MTQLAVSQILGVDECTITNWEKNHSNPMLHLLPKVIEFLVLSFWAMILYLTNPKLWANG
ncbi:MAG: helix-turn-helix transcriptional regulator [Ignavibacteriales bacterium]|nr:helix-turn-helix transcriptional regulator [Ignavibacteriales bacterium]